MRMQEVTGREPGWRAAVWLVVFSVAMAYLEAAVVVYLRDIYYPQGFNFPLAVIDRGTLLVELGREAATIVMLAAAAALAGRVFSERLAFFMLSFAVWDIFYYVWLKLLLGWPENLLTWDILFLIPLPWVGPVLAPLLVSVSMICGAGLILARLWRGGEFRPVLQEWSVVLAAVVLIVLSFVIDIESGLGRKAPETYRWDLLAGGLGAGFYGFFRCLWRTRHDTA